MAANMIMTSKVMLVSDQPAPSLPWEISRWHQDLQVIVETDFANAAKCWAEKRPDLIVFDIDVAIVPSLEAIRRLREEAILPILMLISHSSEPLALETYAAGVDECVMKPISPDLLHAKIKAWLRRSWSLPANLLESLRVGEINLIPSERTLVLRDDHRIPLTNLELRLLYYLMSRPGHTATSDQLCERVWGYGGEGDPATLKNVVYRLRRKIEPDPANPDYIRTVAGVGYRFAMKG
jgi:DNA-binding response OmpR family regulator